MEVEVLAEFESISKNGKKLMPKGLRGVIYEIDAKGDVLLSCNVPGCSWNNKWVSKKDFERKLKFLGLKFIPEVKVGMKVEILEGFKSTN